MFKTLFRYAFNAIFSTVILKYFNNYVLVLLIINRSAEIAKMSNEPF